MRYISNPCCHDKGCLIFEKNCPLSLYAEMQELDRLRREVANLDKLLTTMQSNLDNLYDELSELEDDTRHRKPFIPPNPPIHRRAVSILINCSSSDCTPSRITCKNGKTNPVIKEVVDFFMIVLRPLAGSENKTKNVTACTLTPS